MNKFILNKNESVLFVIDIQEKLVPVMKFGGQVIKNTNVLLSVAAKMQIPVIITEQYPKGLGRTVPEVMNNPGLPAPFEKVSFSGCTDEVRAALKDSGRNKIIVAGMETHVCVFQTVRDLLAHGFEVFVAGDAVCSRTKENYLNGLSLMSSMGAVITNTETVLFDLLKEAGTPLFKELSRLIR